MWIHACYRHAIQTFLDNRTKTKRSSAPTMAIIIKWNWIRTKVHGVQHSLQDCFVCVCVCLDCVRSDTVRWARNYEKRATIVSIGTNPLNVRPDNKHHLYYKCPLGWHLFTPDSPACTPKVCYAETCLLFFCLLLRPAKVILLWNGYFSYSWCIRLCGPRLLAALARKQVQYVENKQ